MIKIGKAVNVNQEVFVVFDEEINFTPRLGVPIHGIIGYDIFKDFVVEINYSSKSLYLTFLYSLLHFQDSIFQSHFYLIVEILQGQVQNNLLLFQKYMLLQK